jgi:hypothetical protein
VRTAISVLAAAVALVAGCSTDEARFSASVSPRPSTPPGPAGPPPGPDRPTGSTVPPGGCPVSPPDPARPEIRLGFAAGQRVTAPARLTVLASGTPDTPADAGDGRRRWHAVADRARDASVAAGTFTVAEQAVDGIRLIVATPAGPDRFDAALRCYANTLAWRIAHPADLARALAALPPAITVLRTAGALP